jgi:3-oxoacyl-[acyl-carrier-protein] synthase II
MASRPNVVITGAGVVSPIGTGLEAFWTSLCEMRSGVIHLPELEGTAFPVTFGGRICDFEPKKYVKPRKALKVMSREIQVGFSAAAMATEHAGLTVPEIDPDRLGVLFGGHMQYCDPRELQDVYAKCMQDGEFDFSRWGDAAMSQMYPLWMLMYLPNMIACHIAISLDARGPNNTISVGDASSLHAIIEAAEMIRTGRVDAMVAGGSSSLLSITPMMYRGALGLSRRNDSPSQACRPFEQERDGSVSAEGGAALVLESESHAEARGATILARLAGWGSAFDTGTRGAEGRGRALQRALHMALDRAELPASDIGHVNANAGGQVEADAIEAEVIRETLGDVPVTAPKSALGNSGAASGAVEMVASLLALTHGTIPATLNYDTPDPRCPVRVVAQPNCPLEQPNGVVLSQSSTGQAAAVTLTCP